MISSFSRTATASAAVLLVVVSLGAATVPRPSDGRSPLRNAAAQAPAGTTVARPAAAGAAVAPRPTPAVAEGARLFVAYNCIDCHGAEGSGAMGPSLADSRWRFGGTPEEIFRSIADGRPEGMPTWGPMIPAADIRALVAYLQSLGAGKDVTTENFTGATVERAGH